MNQIPSRWGRIEFAAGVLTPALLVPMPGTEHMPQPIMINQAQRQAILEARDVRMMGLKARIAVADAIARETGEDQE